MPFLFPSRPAFSSIRAPIAHPLYRLLSVNQIAYPMIRDQLLFFLSSVYFFYFLWFTQAPFAHCIPPKASVGDLFPLERVCPPFFSFFFNFSVS